MSASSFWKELLARRLPTLGHRNWIGIVDAAYPLQIAPGIEMIFTGSAHPTILKEVLRALEGASHVRPKVLLDVELEYIPEKHAPGINILRGKLAKLLGKYAAVCLPHEEVIARLDEVSRLFHVLLFKSTLVLPYTSVFFELDCGYWSAEAERSLRALIPAQKE